MRGGWAKFMCSCFSLKDIRIRPRKQKGKICKDVVPSSSTEPEKVVKPEDVTSGISTVVSVPADVEEFRQITGQGNDVIIFTYSELELATNNFCPDQILGEGGFGIVYKGIINENIRPGFSHTQVAVKELDPEGMQGDREWLAEVNYLGQFSHPNLVKLIGYCSEDENRLLVYEYMACGSLEKHLFERVYLPLRWSTRMKIALDAAKGLAFLHGAERPIIYRDFKTSNILLDEHYHAKLSDFGLAKEGPVGDQTHVSTRVMGTYGYAAPEYVMTGHLTARSDVYTFGVVLVEMLLGSKAMDSNRPGRQRNLVEWARPLLVRSSKLAKIIDPRMGGQYSIKAAQRVAGLAYRCLSQNPKERPTMSEVVVALETLHNPSSPSHNEEENEDGGEAPKETARREKPEGGEKQQQSTKTMVHGRRTKPSNRSRVEAPKDHMHK